MFAHGVQLGRRSVSRGHFERSRVWKFRVCTLGWVIGYEAVETGCDLVVCRFNAVTVMNLVGNVVCILCESLLVTDNYGKPFFLDFIFCPDGEIALCNVSVSTRSNNAMEGYFPKTKS